MDQATLLRATSSGVRVTQVVIDAALRDTSKYANTNSFVVHLAEPIRDVVAIRLARTDYTDAQYGATPAYISLNEYSNLQVANGQSTNFFARLTAGAETFPVSGDAFMTSPYTYVMRPIARKLERFEVKVLTAAGALHPATTAALALTLTIYCNDSRTL